jgi:hypothetical protein
MVPALRADYAVMSEMILGEVPPFDSVLGEIGDIEREINVLKKA